MHQGPLSSCQRLRNGRQNRGHCTLVLENPPRTHSDKNGGADDTLEAKLNTHLAADVAPQQDATSIGAVFSPRNQLSWKERVVLLIARIQSALRIRPDRFGWATSVFAREAAQI
jgi:hypothetical protein